MERLQVAPKGDEGAEKEAAARDEGGVEKVEKVEG